jgi:sugar lactone lactonase YvrE
MPPLAHSRTRRALTAFAVLIVAPVAAACYGDRSAPAEPAAPVAVVDSGLATPESVLWDVARNVWYVSNINGQPGAKDDNGYIVRLSADGALVTPTPFISGAGAAVTLHAPKGMALVGDTLWVADIDAVRAFNVVTGEPVATVDLASMQAIFLNDVAAGADGTIYITDSGIAFDSLGNVSHPGQSRVFAISGRTARQAVVLPRESAANGISWDAARGAWLIVGFNSPSVFSWTPGSDSVTVLGTGPGGGDGLVVLADGRALFSSWADSSLTVFANGAATTVLEGLASPADLGYDAARGLVAVPLFTLDRVEIWNVPAGQ